MSPSPGSLRTQAFSGALGAFVAQPGAPAQPSSPAVDLVAAYGADRLRAMVLGVYAQLRSQGHAAPALPSSAADEWPEAPDAEGARACALLDSLLRDFGERYAALKRERSALDFDDLELRAGALLERAPRRAPELVRAPGAADGGRVPGHQPPPARDPGGAGAREPVHRRRRAAVDLRLPPRRRGPLPRAPRAARRARLEPRADVELPQSPTAAGGHQRGIRHALRRCLHAAASRAARWGRPSRRAVRGWRGKAPGRRRLVRDPPASLRSSCC